MEPQSRILVVDDDRGVAAAIRRVLERAGRTVETVETGEAALRVLRDRGFALVICDLRLPDISGQELVETLGRLHPNTEIIMITAHGSVAAAVEAMRAGAYDFLEKPIRRVHLLRSVDRALERHDLVRENLRLQARLRQERGAFLIGESPAIRDVRATVEQVAPTSVSVLLRGESGTGKEVVADMIHALSDRASRRMIKISCAAIPGNLLESEVFGYEPGAFTGAASSKPGKFELAHLGTLFLDEIAEMDPALQAKLLRALQDGRFQRLGGTRTIAVDVRVVSATNADLAEKMQDKSFREDLYYRLNVITIRLPPLRDRIEDIPLLAVHFLARYADRFAKPVRGLEPGAMDCLAAHRWPGNVRELENVIQRAVAVSRSDMLARDDLGALGGGGGEVGGAEAGAAALSVPLGTPLREIERRLIEETLRRCGGHRETAAALLGISTRTILRKVGTGKSEDASSADSGDAPDGA